MYGSFYLKFHIAILRIAIGYLSLASDVCGPIGSSGAETELDEERDRSFYLNVDDPATCSGYITSWRVCYYGPDDSDDEDQFWQQQRSYWATYAVYRRRSISNRNVFYERVSAMFRAVRATRTSVDARDLDGLVRQDRFACFSDAVDGPPLFVQAGDIIGACVFNLRNAFSFTRHQLNIVGEHRQGSLLQMNDRECTIDNIPSNIPASNLDREQGRRLHLYANIIPGS